VSGVASIRRSQSVLASALPQLAGVGEVLRLFETSQNTEINITGLWGVAKSLLACQLGEQLSRSVLVITPSRHEAEAVVDDAAIFLGSDRCLLLPAWEVLPHEVMDPADDIVAERFDTFLRLVHITNDRKPYLIAAPLAAVLQLVLRPAQLQERSFQLAVGEEHDLDDILFRLTELGYEREIMVEQRGQMSVRGGILDVFPTASELPYRLEFFGDTIESIRRFEPETQRSVGSLESILISPRSEKQLLGEHEGDLTDISAYLPPNTLVVFEEPAALKEEAERIERRVKNESYYLSFEDFMHRVAANPKINVAQFEWAHEGVDIPYVSVNTRSLTAWIPPATDFWSQLDIWAEQDFTVALVCTTTGERTRLLELLEEHGHRVGQDRFDLRLAIGRLREGFVAPEERLAVLSEREVFGRRSIRRRRRRFEAGTPILAFSDLRVGDFVVHEHHGIGRYLGIRKFSDKQGEFLAIDYAGGDRFYIPVTHIDLIQKYTGGAAGTTPKLDRLGGATWARTKARVKKALRDITDELVKLYAARTSTEGYAFSADTPWQAEFEDAFEYEETPDQSRAIIEVKRDMEKPQPMDRLLCGDVGFGKTEVALRAAFKAVQDGKQVAVLVPTTILAEQHYMTFSQRLADYPVRIGLLCRFRSPRQLKETVEKLRTGEIDIVIGTHRLLSRDIEFKDLGLLILDEEHRFGVAQKERLKRLRVNVDVLTMTATPIPRTLNMSLLGVRDMSIINTAPNDRLPVHTCIHVFDENIIREAIERELAREGQCFFVHNRVHNIEPYADLIMKLVPSARVGIGHGQMPETQLEHVMTAFIRQELDVLVCTTIIGSGLDIPNANTIIINNADQFGVSELYQLRGRVGRYKHRAFAYLLVSGERALSEDAQKRLKALEEFSTLGSGFLIAMRDLEIRGCGNLLGAEQHGHIAAVGYDTYCQLIAEAVAEAQGQPVVRRVLPPCDIAIDAYIPEEYVPSEMQRITLYKRIAESKTVQTVDDLYAELTDRFGKPPTPVKRLLDVMRIRALGADHGVSRILAARSQVTLQFEPDRVPERSARNALSRFFGTALSFEWTNTPCLHYNLNAQTPEEMIQVVQKILQAISDTSRLFRNV